MNRFSLIPPLQKVVLLLLSSGMLLSSACVFGRGSTPVAATTPVSPLPAESSPAAAALTPEEQQYEDQVRRQAAQVQASIGAFNELMRTPRPQNDDWKRRVNVEIDKWPTFAPQANQLQAPARYRRFQESYREALAHMGVAATLMREVQQTGNQPLVSEINSRIGEANTAFAEATRRSPTPDLLRVERISVVLATSLVPRQ